MNTATKSLLVSLLLIGSASAMAAPHLTAAQCNDYPFKRTQGEVTHKQLMRELGELEAAGYQPADDDATYPADLQKAKLKVQAEYRADCRPAATHTSASTVQTPAGTAAATAAASARPAAVNQPAG